MDTGNAKLTATRSAQPPSASAAEADWSGRRRMTFNVLSSWAGHLVFIVSGFIMPRLIDRRLGQEALGVWDLSWSLIAYFGLVQAGVISSVNRFVAKYRAENDLAGVNRVLATVTAILGLMGLAVTGLTVGAVLLLEPFFGQRLGEFLPDARWVVLLLGLTLAVQIALAGFGGIITGCHRWGVHNAIYAGGHVVCVIGMITALLLGRGLAALAAVTLAGEALGMLARVVVAYRFQPGLRFSRQNASWAEARLLLGYGGKSFLPNLASLLLNQTTCVLIVAYLGPAALALFSRPMALVRHARTLLEKFSNVLVPTAGAYQAAAREDELRELMIRGSRYAAFLSLPMILSLVILGGPLLRLWMGADYDQSLVLAILAVGYFGLLSQLGTQAVLMGLNAHGRPGLANLAAAVSSVGLTLFALGGLKAGLPGAAAAVALPLLLANGAYMPWYACRKLNLPLWTYLRETWDKPLLCAIPFAVVLLAARLAFGSQALLCLAVGGLGGGAVLLLLYYRLALPESLRERIQKSMTRRRAVSNASV